MENIQLEDIALEDVSGGISIGGFQFEEELNPASCIVGRKYFVVSGMTNWFYGELQEIRGDDYVFGITIRNGHPISKARLNANRDQIRIYSRVVN